jgi:PAS domain-containing protein
MPGLFEAVAIGLVSSLVTALVLFVMPRRTARTQSLTLQGESPSRDDDVVFLFNDGTLIDATSAARSQLPAEPAQANDIARLVISYCQRFEGLADRLDGFSPGNRFEISEVPDDPDSLRLVAENRSGNIRISLFDPLRDSRSGVVAHYSLAALRAELFTLRSIAERSPIPTWKRRHDGTIIWANGTYMSLASSVAGEESLIGWPPPDVFAAVYAPYKDMAENAPLPTQRVSLKIDDPQCSNLWFDMIALPGEIETLYFALPIDKLVRAENALTEFVQTLTKTFAHLRIGLAIFDQKRRLALFNPALVDLTGLRAEQLSSRPTLHAFLDALRDAQRIPEPKDYKSWRMQIAQLEAGAADGTFEETWHLSDGQTYRVSGRPHPDGAVAYLFEDISSEVSKTRTFRSEIELGQAVIDNLDTAIVAFSQNGTLTMCNRAYRSLWGGVGGNVKDTPGVVDATRRWHDLCRPGVDWDAISARIMRPSDRLPWSGHVTLQDGTDLLCDLAPISGGATLVTFSKRGGAGGQRLSDLSQASEDCPQDTQAQAVARACAS